MKGKVLFLLLFTPLRAVYAQDYQDHSFLRFYVDNDAIVPSYKASDWGYTSGNRIDFFYPSKTGKHGFFQWTRKIAGNGSNSTSGWSLMQLIVTPVKTSLTIPDRKDYPYAGALLGIHTVHSANATKKISFQMDYVTGIMGPSSFAKEIHSSFHELINELPAKGWDRQLPNDLLLNADFRTEKYITGKEKVNLMGGGVLRCGTMENSLFLHLMLQAGNNKDYFRGLRKRYFSEKKAKFAISLKTIAGFVFYNALLQGGLFNPESPLRNKESIYGSNLNMNLFNCSAELFCLFALKKFAISFSQRISSPELKNYKVHSIGNVSAYFQL